MPTRCARGQTDFGGDAGRSLKIGESSMTLLRSFHSCKNLCTINNARYGQPFFWDNIFRLILEENVLSRIMIIMESHEISQSKANKVLICSVRSAYNIIQCAAPPVWLHVFNNI